MKLRWLAALLLLCVAVLLAPGLARADGDDPEFLPPRVGKVDAKAGTRLINRYPLWRYTWDGDSSYQTDAGRTAAGRMNLLLGYKAWSVKATTRVLQAPLDLHPGTLLADELESVSGGLTAALWQGGGAALVTAALTLAGFVAFCVGALRSGGAGWRLLSRTMMLLLVALALLLNLSPLLRGLDLVGGELSGATFAAVNPNGAATLDDFADAVWQPLIVDPWLLGEFGRQATAVRYGVNGQPGGQFLPLRSTDRSTRYYQLSYVDRQWDFSWWTMDYVLPRQVLAGVTGLLALPVVVTGLLLAGGWLLYQVVTVLLLAGLPLLLLVALWLPEQGPTLVRRWLLRLFSLLVLQVALAFLLGGWVRLSLVTAGLDLGGWMGTDALLALVSVAVLVTRREWLGLVGVLMRPGSAHPGWLGRLSDALQHRHAEPAAAAALAVQAPRASLLTLPTQPEVATGVTAPVVSGGGSARAVFEREYHLQERTQTYTDSRRTMRGASSAALDVDGQAPAPTGATPTDADAGTGAPARDPVLVSQRALAKKRSGPKE